MKEPEILAQVLDNTRYLTKMYLFREKDIDKEKRFQINNFTTCSIHWIIAHLAWAENYLILKSVGKTGSGKGWFEHFEIGTEYPDKLNFPPFEETLETFNDIHEQSIKLLQELNEEELDKPNHTRLKFGTDDSKRIIINHCIRHEGVHCGHLGWLLRMNGKKFI